MDTQKTEPMDTLQKAAICKSGREATEETELANSLALGLQIL